jgi:hypothetical protein
MALRLRRGSNAERLQITPAEGEIIYTTDTKKIYVGDGNKLGGNLVSGINETVEDVNPSLGGNLNINGHNIYGTGNITITGNMTATGTLTTSAITSDITGSVFGDDSTVLVDAINNKINLANNLLTELEDVSADNPAEGNVLTWNNQLMVWEASAPAGGNNGTGSWSGNVYNSDGSLLLVDGTVGAEKIYLNNNNLFDLADVSYDDTVIQNDWVLAWNETEGKFLAKSMNTATGDIIGSGDPAPTLVDTVNNKVYLDNNKLTDLSDVILPESPTNGYVLKYDDQQGWVQSTVLDTDSITEQNPLLIPYISTTMITGSITGAIYANDGTLLMDPNNKTFALEQNDLHNLKNVSANNPPNNNVLYWNAGTSMWAAASISELINNVGWLESDAFKGSFFGDDSSILLDGLTGTVHPSSIKFTQTEIYENPIDQGELTVAGNVNPSLVLLGPINEEGRPNLELRTINGTVENPNPIQAGDWLYNIWWTGITNRPSAPSDGKETFGNLFCRIPSTADFVNDTTIPSEWLITNNHRTQQLNISGFLSSGAVMASTLQLSRMDTSGNFVHFADTTARDSFIENSPVEGMITYVQDRGDGTPAFLGYKGGSVNAWVNLEQNSTPTVYGSSDVDSHLNTGTAADGQILSWNASLLSGAGDYEWVAQSGGGGATNMASLTDVDGVDTVTTGDVLLHDGSEYKFVNLEGEINTRADARIGVASIQDLSDVDSVDTVAAGDFLLYDGNSSEYKFVAFEAEVNGLIDSRTGSSGHISTQSQYAGIITTDPADPTDTAHHVLGNTGTPSVHTASTAWYYGDVVSDPANPTTSVVLNVDSGQLTGSVIGNITSNGTSTFSGTVDFTNASSIDFTGATVSGLSSPPEYEFTVVNNGASHYTFSGVGTNSDDDPTIYLHRGQTYHFAVNAVGHPFYIKTAQTTGTTDQFTSGVTNNGADQGTVTFTVPHDAPATLYYICGVHSSMSGTINILEVAGSAATDIVSEGNTSIETVDTGTDGQIKFTTEGTHRWSFDSSGHLIPTTNAAYDFGSAELKVRHFYLSSNSLYIGDDFTFGVSDEDGQPEFRKRKKQANHIPKRILELALADVALNLADAAAVIAHALAWMNTQLDPDATDLSDTRITLKLWWLYGNDNIANFAATIPDPNDILPPPGDANFDKGDYDQIIKLGQQGFAKAPILDGSAPIIIPLKANFPYFIVNNVTGPFDVVVHEVPPVEGGSFEFTLYVNQGAGGGNMGTVIIKNLEGNDVPVDPINIRTVGSVVENTLQIMEVKAFFLAGSWKIINQII